MIEEPYRWVEAIANRAEYIETQLASGSPIVALGYRDGILFLTLGKTRQKLFEIYDRIAMGAIGHPGDIERLRMAAIELASTEGFTRAAADVSLRRLAHYSLSPVLKTAFEQVYGAPYLARLLFAEIGAKQENDLFLRLDYDGAIATNNATFERGLKLSLDAWTVGQLALGDEGVNELPSRDKIVAEKKERLRAAGIEAAVLDRGDRSAIRYRTLNEQEIRSALGD